MATREDLHRLVDYIPEREVATTQKLLRALMVPVELAILSAEEDDEPESEDERATVQAALADPRPDVPLMTRDKRNAQIIREMIIHESNLVNHRLTWVTTLQGFLFAALAFAWKDARPFVPVLVVVGSVSSLSVLQSLYFAHTAMEKLYNDWKNAKPSKEEPTYSGPDVIGYRSSSPFRFCLPWFLLPILLVLAWIYIGVMLAFRISPRC